MKEGTAPSGPLRKFGSLTHPGTVAKCLSLRRERVLGAEYCQALLRRHNRTRNLPLRLKPMIERRQVLTLPRFYRHLHKEENDEIGGAHAKNNATSVYRRI